MRRGSTTCIPNRKPNFLTSALSKSIQNGSIRSRQWRVANKFRTQYGDYFVIGLARDEFVGTSFIQQIERKAPSSTSFQFVDNNYDKRGPDCSGFDWITS